MKRVIEYIVLIIFVSLLVYTVVVDRMDKYTLESNDGLNIEKTLPKDTLPKDTTHSSQNILEQIQSIDSIVINRKDNSDKLIIKTKHYKDSIKLLKSKMLKEADGYQKEKDDFQREKEIYKRQKEEFERENNRLREEKESLNSKYNKEHELNELYNRPLHQPQDSIPLDTLIKSKKKKR